VLRDGVVQQIGTPVEIYEKPANRFVAGFFGTPTMNFFAAHLTQAGDQRTARGPGFEIPLADRKSALRPAAESDTIVVGIRPERLSLASRAGGVALSGQVAMREVLGAEVVLHLESAAGPLTVRTDAGSAPRPGDSVQVWLEPHAVHIFDGTTEVRL